MNFWINYEKRRHPDKSPGELRYLISQQIGFVSIALNLFLAGVKLMTGYFARSISIQADGFNNLSDAANNLGILIFFRLAQKRPDEKHPYGYERLESIASLFLGMMIAFIGYQILMDSINKILHPSAILFSWSAVAVLVLSIVIKGLMALGYYRSGKVLKSTLLEAYGMDARNDALSTLLVLVSILGAHYLNVHLDGYMGVIMAGFILYSAYGLLKSIISRLLGEANDPDQLKALRSRILSSREIVNVHDIKIHSYGPSRNYATAHVEMMDDHKSLSEAHNIVDIIERKVYKDLNIDLVIHIDPIVVADQSFNKCYERFADIISCIDESWILQDFRIVQRNDIPWVFFDLEIPYNQDLDELQAESLIRQHLKPEEKYHIILKIEHK